MPESAVERFLPDVDRTRRAAGWVIASLASAAGAGLLWLVAESGRMTITGFVVLAILAVALRWSLGLARRPTTALDVDVANRRYVLVRRDGQPASGPLDELGPLCVVERARLSGAPGSSGSRTVIEYVVHAAIHKKIDLYVMRTPGQARQRMEVLGRRWRLPCRSLGGDVRRAEDLDRPLHERLRDDAGVRRVTELRPEWRVRLERIGRDHVLSSENRSWGSLVQSVIFGAVVLVLTLGRNSIATIHELLAEGGDVVQNVLSSLLVVVILVLIWYLWQGVRDALWPGAVRVGSEGVRYRWSRMRLEQIEEVAAAGTIEIVGDRKIIELSPSFCPVGARTAVARELERLIVEAGSPGSLASARAASDDGS